MVTASEAQEFAGRFPFYDNSKMRNDLGLEPRSLEDCLTECGLWFTHMGWLKQNVAERMKSLDSPLKSEPWLLQAAK
jgi:hypothetical protein